MEKSKDRLAILDKIAEYEKRGWFDKDVENDPPTRPLRPGECDYLAEKPSTRILTGISNRIAKRHFDRKIREGELIIKRIRGIDNYLAIRDRGAMITCNHFNPYDNYAVFKAIEPYLGKRRLYKVIREGNYTSFPGLYGVFFRHCNTLPLAASVPVMKEFLNAVSVLLKRGEKILIYPEQGMWWNYRKPRPLKPGAFRFAASAGAPVLPVFITMEDSDKTGADGFPIQAYTLHFLPAIWPDGDIPVRRAAEKMAAENYRMWKEVYERTYGMPLTYGGEN